MMTRALAALVLVLAALLCVHGCTGKQEDAPKPNQSAGPQPEEKVSPQGNAAPAISAAPEMELNENAAKNAESRLGSKSNGN